MKSPLAFTKSLLLGLAFTFVATIGFSQSDSTDAKLLKVDKASGLTVYKSDGKAFTGISLSSYTKTKHKEFITYKDGKKDGPERTWYRNGKTKHEGQFENNSMEGVWKYYHMHGELMYDKTYHEDQLHGSFKHYHPNGQISTEGQYAEGKKSGKWTFTDEKGNHFKDVEY